VNVSVQRITPLIWRNIWRTLFFRDCDQGSLFHSCNKRGISGFFNAVAAKHCFIFDQKIIFVRRNSRDGTGHAWTEEKGICLVIIIIKEYTGTG